MMPNMMFRSRMISKMLKALSKRSLTSTKVSDYIRVRCLGIGIRDRGSVIIRVSN